MKALRQISGALLCSLFAIGLSAQIDCTHQYRALAHVLVQNGEWQKGLKYFDLYADGGGTFNAFDRLDQGRASLALGDTNTFCSDLSKAVELGAQWSGENKFLSIGDAFPVEVATWLTKDRIAYDQHHDAYLRRLDKTLIEKIAMMAKRDQEVRLTRRNGSEKEHNAIIHRTDSLHLEEVKQILEKFNGFPPDSLIERKTKFELMLLIQHFIRGFPDSYDYFASIANRAIANFQLHPGEFAAMADRRQYDIDRKSIYGEVPYRNEAGELVVDNIQNIDQVDSLRFSIGLLSLKQHSLDRGFILPVGYTEQRSPCSLD